MTYIAEQFLIPFTNLHFFIKLRLHILETHDFVFKKAFFPQATIDWFNKISKTQFSYVKLTLKRCFYDCNCLAVLKIDQFNFSEWDYYSNKRNQFEIRVSQQMQLDHKQISYIEEILKANVS